MGSRAGERGAKATGRAKARPYVADIALMSVVAGTGREVARPEYTLHVDEIGEDVPVLVVHHALGSFEDLCDPERGAPAEALAARGCRVIGFDLAGHGLSGAVAEFPADFLDRSAEDAVAVMESCGIGGVAAAVGIGFGGLVAIRLAAMRPRRVRCVVVDSVPGVLASTPVEPWPGQTGPVGEDGYDPAPAWLRYAAELDEARLVPPRLDVPALLFACRTDAPAEQNRMAALARTLGTARVAWSEMADPPVCWSDPAFFLTEVERFLAVHA